MTQEPHRIMRAAIAARHHIDDWNNQQVGGGVGVGAGVGVGGGDGVAAGAAVDFLNVVQGSIGNPLHPAALSATPRNLYDLWTEWMVGIGGNKPARLFNLQERGKVKHKFCRRNVVWKLVSKLVNSRLTHHVAYDHNYKVYGQRATVTQIIERLKAEICNNTLH